MLLALDEVFSSTEPGAYAVARAIVSCHRVVCLLTVFMFVPRWAFATSHVATEESTVHNN
jgi:hypothetical protein